MSKDSSARYQKDKERLQKKVVKGIEIFVKRSKTKSENVVTNNIKLFQKMKTTSWLTTEKNIMYGKIKLLHK